MQTEIISETQAIREAMPAALLARLEREAPCTVEYALWAWLQEAYPGPSDEELADLALHAARFGFDPDAAVFCATYRREAIEASAQACHAWDAARTVEAALVYAAAVIASTYAVRDALLAWQAQGGEG